MRRVYQGIGASPGVGIGEVAVFDRQTVLIARRHVSADAVDGEIGRLEAAMAEARREVEGVLETLSAGTGADHRLLLQTQLLMLGDEMISTAASSAIRSGRINAEWAVRQSVDAICARLRSAADPLFRERATDVYNVGEHLLRALTGVRAREMPALDRPTILVASDLTPAEATHLTASRVLALVTDSGSASSHTAILARALQIPAVVGIADITRAVGPGDTVIVDAMRGEVIVHPDPHEVEEARARGDRFEAFRERLRDVERGARETADGVPVALHANVDFEMDLPDVKHEGADGIGLYRTEFLYLDRSAAPPEEEQASVYTRVAQRMAPRPVVFRTFDLGADKMPTAMRRSPNPALGVRALRLAFERPELLVTQLRALLRAATAGDVRVMFPMVSSVADLRRAKEMLETARADLDAQGVAYGPVLIGSMLEVPSAVLVAERLALECDFFSVGTNDLTQYTLAVDRGDPRVAHLASSLDPSVLRLLQRARSVATTHGTPISVCGDLAADPVATPLLVGLGFRSLSMSTAAIPLIAEVLRRLRVDEAVEIATEALDLDGAADVERLIAARLDDRLGDLWREQGILLPR